MEYAFDPCANAERLNFDDPADLRRSLMRDKHTRVEGLCAEAAFARDLLAESYPDHSSGWWCYTKAGGYRVLKFVADASPLSELDLKLLSLFAQHATAGVVRFDQAAREFHYVKIVPKALDDLKLYWAENWRPFRRKTRPVPLPNSAVRSPERLRRACDRLESLGLLKRAAVERLFVNCWLEAEALWDIDAFVPHGDQLLTFEVKQKFPNRAGNFGLNAGLVRLFSFLALTGIRMIHVILTKPVWDDAIPALDFYTQPKYAGLSLWLAAEFSAEIISTRASTAPAATSIYGTRRLDYHPIAPSRFHRLKIYGSGPTTALRDFVEGRTSPLNGMGDIPVYRHETR